MSESRKTRGFLNTLMRSTTGLWGWGLMNWPVGAAFLSGWVHLQRPWWSKNVYWGLVDKNIFWWITQDEEIYTWGRTQRSRTIYLLTNSLDMMFFLSLPLIDSECEIHDHPVLRWETFLNHIMCWTIIPSYELISLSPRWSSAIK